MLQPVPPQPSFSNILLSNPSQLVWTHIHLGYAYVINMLLLGAQHIVPCALMALAPSYKTSPSTCLGYYDQTTLSMYHATSTICSIHVAYIRGVHGRFRPVFDYFFARNRSSRFSTYSHRRRPSASVLISFGWPFISVGLRFLVDEFQTAFSPQTIQNYTKNKRKIMRQIGEESNYMENNPDWGDNYQKR